MQFEMNEQKKYIGSSDLMFSAQKFLLSFDLHSALTYTEKKNTIPELANDTVKYYLKKTTNPT